MFGRLVTDSAVPSWHCLHWSTPWARSLITRHCVRPAPRSSILRLILRIIPLMIRQGPSGYRGIASARPERRGRHEPIDEGALRFAGSRVMGKRAEGAWIRATFSYMDAPAQIRPTEQGLEKNHAVHSHQPVNARQALGIWLRRRRTDNTHCS